MKMIKTICLALATAGVMTVSAQAASITGGLSFSGGYSADNNDLTLATSIAFLSASVQGPTTGSFLAEGVVNGNAVSMFTPLGVNAFLVVPGSPIWSVGGFGGFTLNLATLIETGNTINTLALEGTGTLKHALYDDTPGTWFATFNTAGGTFSWSASSGADRVNVPDGGMTVAMLGLALSGLGLMRRKMVA